MNVTKNGTDTYWFDASIKPINILSLDGGKTYGIREFVEIWVGGSGAYAFDCFEIVPSYTYTGTGTASGYVDVNNSTMIGGVTIVGGSSSTSRYYLQNGTCSMTVDFSGFMYKSSNNTNFRVYYVKS